MTVTTELLKAYRATNYLLTPTSGEIDRFNLHPHTEQGWQFNEQGMACCALVLQTRSSVLAQLYRQCAVRSAVFITAWNPRSEVKGKKDNVAAQLLLREECRCRDLRSISGVSRDPGGAWPDEESVLVLGVSLVEARALGVQFHQYAVVWANGDAVPGLVIV